MAEYLSVNEGPNRKQRAANSAFYFKLRRKLYKAIHRRCPDADTRRMTLQELAWWLGRRIG